MSDKMEKFYKNIEWNFCKTWNREWVLFSFDRDGCYCFDKTAMFHMCSQTGFVLGVEFITKRTYNAEILGFGVADGEAFENREFDGV